MSMFSKRPLRQFPRDRRGNVAMLFGLMAIPVFGVIGTAIDYARAAKTRQELQSLIDGAALAATSEFSKTGDAAKATQRLRSLVADGLSKYDLSLLPPPQDGEEPPALGNDGRQVMLENAEFDGESGSVTPKLTNRVATTLLAILDQPYFEVTAEAKAALAGKKLELSMMLDITGSMCDSGGSCSAGVKLDGMKAAANDLIDIVFTGNAANTRVAIVPFSSAVNVGMHAAGVTGQPATTSYTYKCGHKNRSTCTGTKYRTNCVTERTGSSRFLDDAPGSGSYSAAVWSTSSSASCTPGANASIVPLTNTRSVLETKIAGLQASGSTAGQLGTAWSWYTISDKWASFWGGDSAPEPAAPTLLKAAVLMTDGEYNTCNGSNGCSTSDDDARTLCANMKAQGIRVFTVGFAIDNSNARDTLIQCASPGDYHFPYSPEDMREAFRSIGNALVAGTAGPVLAN